MPGVRPKVQTQFPILNTYSTSGDILQTTDARGIPTYGPIPCPDGTYSDLYSTQREEAYGTAEKRTTQFGYDCSRGLVNVATDADNAVSTVTTYDHFGRPVLI